jgi:hypothetical protein
LYIQAVDQLLKVLLDILKPITNFCCAIIGFSRKKNKTNPPVKASIPMTLFEWHSEEAWHWQSTGFSISTQSTH